MRAVLSSVKRFLRRLFSFARRSPDILKRVYHLDDTIERLERDAARQTENLERLDRIAQRMDLTIRPVPNPKELIRDNLSVAVVGTRGHGKSHIKNFMALDETEITYICDVDFALGDRAADEIGLKTGRRPRVRSDIREVLADPTVDVVSVATPHHWHALATIWALQAGKHVYVEKPLTHTFDEGLAVIAATEKYRRLVQHGTQLRSNTSLGAAAAFMQGGGLGDIEVVHCITHKPRTPIPDKEPKVPASVDYDLWVGPAEMKPPERGGFHYHWHWFWDYGNGALGNNGIHRIDVARIGLGLEGLGDSVLTYGGRYGPPDSGETPNTSVTIHRFGDTWVVQEILGLPTEPHLGVSNGIIFYGTEGNITYHKGSAAITGQDGEVLKRFPGSQLNHIKGFVDAVKGNDPDLITGTVEEGHVSSALCHLGNISYLVGDDASDAEVTSAVDALGAPPMIRGLLEKVRANLNTNGASGDLVLGQSLGLSKELSPIVGNAEASALLARKYREPYVVPTPAEV